MEKPREPRVGDAVIFFDSLRNELSAILTAVHGEVSSSQVSYGDPTQKWNTPCVNLVYVTPDEGKTDSWGRQTDHASSCTYVEHQYPKVGMYWCWPEEVDACRPDETQVQTQR
jgi:hypothetical protein